MIYLISGAPRCGKTTIAKKLAKKLHISWISADTLESIVKINISPNDRKRLFPKDIIRKETKQSNDIMYTKYNPKEIKNAYIKQAKASWKAISTLIDCKIREGNNFIIEGHQLHPKLIFDLTKKYGKENIRSLILTRFSVNKIIEGCLKNKAKNDWFIQKTKENKTYYKMAEMIKEYSYFFEKEAKKYKIDIANVDTNFLDQINQSIKLLQGHLK